MPTRTIAYLRVSTERQADREPRAMGARRNPVAHDTSLTEREALYRLTIISVLNFRLDSAKRTRAPRRQN